MCSYAEPFDDSISGIVSILVKYFKIQRQVKIKETTFWNHRLINVIVGGLTIGSYVSVCSSRYAARGKFGEHERCVRVALGYASSNSYTSFVLSKLTACCISR